MQDTIKTVMEWSEQAFPDATLVGQTGKFEDELTEYFNATNHQDRIKELADIFIVAMSICRFGLGEGLYYLQRAWKIYEGSPYSLGNVCYNIQEKMKINRSRKWEKKDGQYQHIEE
jgi:hypothetical protein